ncbi:serine-protein kinase ATM-like isoform X2 [Lineus longissimus]|uniref:serine-protein kinase ATM-like isoform X2 n=1 Tax=Lineus longissimus TaxID=88925 RepID=UPI002B4EA818
MDILIDFGSCCRDAASSEKITERKKYVEKIQKYFKNPALLDALDANTDKGSKDITWPNVFKYCGRIIRLDSEAFRKSKTPASSTAQSNQEKKKQSVLSFFRLIIKTGNRRRRLGADIVVSHILKELGNQFICECLGGSYLSILQKDVLSSKYYTMGLSAHHWTELIKMLIYLHKAPPASITNAMITKVLLQSISIACNNSDLLTNEPFKVFLTIFQNMRVEHNIRELLVAVNCFCETLATQSRTQVCHLGEEVNQELLWLWNNRPSDVEKDGIVQFWCLQMTGHHPCGARTSKEGAYAFDWNVWRHQLQNIYGAISTYLQQLSGKTRFSMHQKDALLKDNYVYLASEVFHQIFSNDGAICDVTQTDDDANNVKKRKLESGWQGLHDNLLSDVDQKPWLQVLHALLKKYQTDMPSKDVSLFLEMFNQLLMKTKSGDVTVWYMQCLEALAMRWKGVGTGKGFDHSQLCLWKKIADATLRLVSLHHAEGSSFRLLSHLVQLNLITTGQEMWSIFPASSPAVSNESLRYLATIMQNTDIPNSVLLGPAHRETHQLRSQLINWLFPNKENVDENVNARFFPDDLKTTLVAVVLSRLMTQDNTCDITTPMDTQESASVFETIGKSFLEISFDVVEEKQREVVTSAVRSSPVPVLFEIQNRIEEAIVTEVKYLAQMEGNKVKIIYELIMMSDIISRLLQLYLTLGVLDGEVLSHSRLFDALKFSLGKVSEACPQIVSKYTNGVIPILEQLEAFFSVPRTGSWYELFCEKLVSVTPRKLLEHLLNLATSDKRSNVDSDPFNTTVLNNQTQDTCIFEMTTDDPSMILDDFEEDELVIESKTDVSNHSALSPSALTDLQKVQVASVRVLAAWSFLHWDRGLVQLDPITVQEKLLDMFCEGEFQPTKAVHLQMMTNYIRMVCENSSTKKPLSDDTLYTLIDALRRVFSSHQKDTEMTYASLQLLGKLLPLLVADGSQLVDSCELAKHLLNIFVKSKKDHVHCVKVGKELYKCLHTLVRLDPDQKWAVFKSNREDVTAVKALQLGLKDRHTAVRMMVATQAVQSLFVKSEGDKIVPLNRSLQEESFDSLYGVMKDILTVEGHLSPNEEQDESVNRTSSFLHTLATVAKSSIVCQRKVFMAFCLLVKESRINIKLVKKVLLQISKYLGFTSLSLWAGANLSYVIRQWLNIKYTIDNFPYQLTDCKDLPTFYRTFQSILVPLLLMRKDDDGITIIATSQQLSIADLVVSCLPKVMVHILPLLAISKGFPCSDEIKAQSKLASECFKNLESLVSKKAIENCMKGYIDEIVVDILMLTHDSNDGAGDADFIRNTQPEPNPPFFSKAIILTTLNYLTQCYAGSAKSLVSLLAVQRDGIQKALLSLRIHLNKAYQQYARRRVLVAYQIFVELLMKEFDDQLGGNWAFVLRDVIYTLVHLQQDLGKDGMELGPVASEIFSLSCDVMFLMCRVGVECCAEELGRFLPVIVSSLIPWIRSGGARVKMCTQIINLILENSAQLSQSIALLDPFPNEPGFTLVRSVQERLKYAKEKFSLEQEIKHFLNAGEHLPDANCRLEGLNFLYQQLSKRKRELGALQVECRGKNESSVLVQLICTLVQMVQVAHTSPDIKQAAAKCLGEIGPIDLGVTALLRPVQNAGLAAALEVFKGKPEMERNCHIMHKLDKYLTESCTEIVQAASDVLKAILNTEAGASFAEEYKKKVEGPFIFYIQPFRSTKKKLLSQTSSAMIRGIDDIDDVNLWLPDHNDHDKWISDLVCAILSSGVITDPILSQLEPICKVKAPFCVEILPYLVHSMLLQDVDALHDILSQQVCAFFIRQCGLVEQESTRVTTPALGKEIDDATICQNQQAVKCLLNLVQYLRQQPRPQHGRRERTVWENNFWLDVDYLIIAKAAQSCGKHFTALMYTEIWCSQIRDKQVRESGSSSSKSYSSQSSESSQLSSLPEEKRCNVQGQLLEAYRAIGDPDGVYGCGISCLGDSLSRTKMYEHENQWDKALCSYDLDMDIPRMTTQLGLLNSLKNFGSSHVLDMYLKGLEGQGLTGSKEFDQFQYEAALRCGKWDLDVPTRLTQGLSFSQAIYWSCLCVNKKDECAFFKTVDTARSAFIGETFTVESVTGLYQVLCKLHAINQVEDVGHLFFRDGKTSDCLKKWTSYMAPFENQFIFTEPVLQTRTRLLNLLLDVKVDPEILEGLQRQTELLVRQARTAGQYQVAVNAIHKLEQASQPQTMLTMRIEEAKLFWSKGESNTAMYMMNECLKTLKQLEDTEAHVCAHGLSLYGEWLAETHSASPQVIMEEYLQKSVGLIEGNGDAHIALAKFADTQYQSIVNYMKSGIYESRVAAMAKARDKAEMLSASGSLEISDQKYLRFLNKQNILEEKEGNSMLSDRMCYLRKAVENYISGLCHSDEHDLHVVRLISLWFDNPNEEAVCQLMKYAIGKLKSHKFIPLMYQLAARMSKEDNLFQETLGQLIYKTSVSHPYHCFYIILALYHADKDEEFLNVGKVTKRQLSRSNSTAKALEQERVLAAKDVVQRLQQSQRADILQAVERVCVAYIQLANVDATSFKGQKAVKIPSKLKISQLKNLALVAVPTMDTPVDPTCHYDHITSLVGFQPTFGLVGGINVPKLVTSLASDGVTRRQLVKGKDDLRQDAVMQQVFEMVNTLLQRDPEAKRRNLAIRRYKVVPLSQRSGVLEWCENTRPLADILIGSSGAHERYRPRDWNPVECRNNMREVAGLTYQERLAVYLNICKHFAPVFRHFFMEQFPQPAKWYEKRMAYTRSVATNSIVGYILGLGDRHLNNILMDCNTAEFIHIDLGVAFEQGKVLPTPETVPFRLTRDIVDGMGVSGVEGVFRRSCEKTMEVMRQNQEALLTILQVLLYDPLYQWTMSPTKAYQLQQRKDMTDHGVSLDGNATCEIPDLDQKDDNAGGDTNELAERVLLRLRQKLQGLEDGIQRSVTGQVNMLVQEAIDSHNLSRLYCGWQPFV